MTFDLNQPMFYDLCLGDVGLAQSVATSHHPDRLGLASLLACELVYQAIAIAWNVDAGTVNAAFYGAREGWK